MDVCVLLYVLLGALICDGACGVFSSNDCGDAKVCFTYPENCNPATAECLFFSSTWNGTHFYMELSGGIGNGSEYNSVAFGQIDAMQDADLYYCTGMDLVSGVITELHDQPTKLNIDEEPGISDDVASTNNGVAECTFTRAPSITKNITNGPKDFDLSAETYYILIAHGNIDSTTGNVRYHRERRHISDSRINLAVMPATEAPQITSTETPAAETEPASKSTPTVQPEPAGSSPCRIDDNCFQMPEDCSPESPDCVRFTWSFEKDTKKFNMQITGGGIGDGKSYAGVAFGKVDKMENNDLYYCTGQSLESAAITTLHKPPQRLNILEEPGIEIIGNGAANGVANCSFIRAASITKPITGEREQDYDLTDGKYYILLAKGAMKGGNLSYHFENRSITSEPVQLGSGAASLFKSVYWVFLLSGLLLTTNF